MIMWMCNGVEGFLPDDPFWYTYPVQEAIIQGRSPAMQPVQRRTSRLENYSLCHVFPFRPVGPSSLIKC